MFRQQGRKKGKKRTLQNVLRMMACESLEICEVLCDPISFMGSWRELFLGLSVITILLMKVPQKDTKME